MLVRREVFEMRVEICWIKTLEVAVIIRNSPRAGLAAHAIRTEVSVSVEFAAEAVQVAAAFAEAFAAVVVVLG